MAYSTISKPSLYFNTKLWTGTGSNGNAISGVGFAPDWVWVKNRSETFDHVLFDRVRGDNKHIESNNTSAEENEANTLAFGSDGYSVGTNTLNKSGNNIVGWNWKAGGGQGSSNTDGSINTTYTSVNTTAGFSISQYTGTGSAATIGHGLSAAPKVVLIKRTSTTGNWVLGHGSLGFTKFIEFTNGAEQTHSGRFNDTAPTSSVFSVGNSAEVNSSGATFIAYCFAEKKGYSKFGSYNGNGNADGTFVYTGFKPAWVMWKKTATENWGVSDSKRDTFNVLNNKLRPDENQAESTSNAHMDFLSNGFKFRSSSGEFNGSGGTYIFMAFAEEPLVANVGNSIPTTAR